MAARQPFLSKSRLISAWQCAKKLHLEKHHKELGVVSAQTESLFATGHQVGDIAKRLYGTSKSVEVAFDFKTMLADTAALLDGDADFPIFEASFRHEGVLVRVDVLVPDGDGWRFIEVKASTSVKDYHVLDCAIQDWVLRNSGLQITAVSLAHVDNRFVYPGDGNYEGLLVETDLTDQVRALEPQVVELLGKARTAVAGEMPEVNVGAHCTKPYECQFQTYCWPTDTRYPITGLGGNKAKLGELVVAGVHDILDIDENLLSSETQQRIYRVTCKGEAEVLAAANAELAELPGPHYFLDFETIAPAVPFWAGTRPYAAVPVQWSIHIEDGGELRHAEFLDLSGQPPMRELTESMIETLGASGPVFMYTNYEERVIKSLMEFYPDLQEPLQQIIDRLFDLHPLVKANYYHPDMLGSWSIKAVLPCIAPHMSYDMLDGISEGTAAADGFLEAIDPHTDMLRKLQLEDQLKRYCRFDTEAMVEIVRFFT